jgi:hypothetical protein
VRSIAARRVHSYFTILRCACLDLYSVFADHLCYCDQYAIRIHQLVNIFKAGETRIIANGRKTLWEQSGRKMEISNTHRAVMTTVEVKWDTRFGSSMNALDGEEFLLMNVNVSIRLSDRMSILGWSVFPRVLDNTIIILKAKNNRSYQFLIFQIIVKEFKVIRIFIASIGINRPYSFIVISSIKTIQKEVSLP